MGGKALKEGLTERKSREDYFRISSHVCDALARIFPGVKALPTSSYSTKETFGDADIIIESDDLPPDWQQRIIDTFKPNDTYPNGDVFSFDYQRLQIDLIKSKKSDYHFAYSYYGWSDLGNFMGRVAHKMGFKYGHDGLWCMLRDNKNHKIADILVSLDVRAVMEFIGYDFHRFEMGFDTLEDIFVFASSTPYFHRDIFQLHNRNHISRVRDAKRPSYMAFLKWMEDHPELDRYQWSIYTGDVVTDERKKERDDWMQKAFDVFSGFKEKVEEAYALHSVIQQAKEKWNGKLAGEVSGYEGKKLGEFMAFCRNNRPTWPPETIGKSFEEWILTQGPESIKGFILDRKDMFEENTDD